MTQHNGQTNGTNPENGNRFDTVPAFLRPLEINPEEEKAQLQPIIDQLREYHLENRERLENSTPQPEEPMSRRGYIHRSVYPEDGQTIRYKNIRPMDPDHVLKLALSMIEDGQQSECMADLIEDGATVRILAGQHRYMAVWAINMARAEIGMTPYPLEVKVTPQEMSERDILTTQLHENLQNKMKSHDKARVIYDMWLDYCRFCETQEIKATQIGFIEFAARGLGKGEVASAIQFGDLDPRVQALVMHEAMVYTHALVLGQLDERLFPDDEKRREKQFRAAVYAVSANLRRDEMKRYVNGIIQETMQASFDDLPANQLMDMFFKPQTMSEEFGITFNRVGTRQALEAAGYFKRIQQLIRALDYDNRIYFTQAVVGAIVEIINGGEEFLAFLEDANPQAAQEVRNRTGKWNR
jgi:hypothetical protein